MDVAMIVQSWTRDAGSRGIPRDGTGRDQIIRPARDVRDYAGRIFFSKSKLFMKFNINFA